MFSLFDPLVDFSCPHCHQSLRFRRVQELPASTGSPNFLCACPVCKGEIILRQHRAFPDNWRWMAFLAPGMAVSASGIFVPALAGLLPFGVALMALGLLALVAYMIRQRWKWRCYVLPADIAPPPTQTPTRPAPEQPPA